jgi:hypothetical protein
MQEKSVKRLKAAGLPVLYARKVRVGLRIFSAGPPGYYCRT